MPIFDITLRIISVASINGTGVADFAIGERSKVAGRAQGRTVGTMKTSFGMLFRSDLGLIVLHVENWGVGPTVVVPPAGISVHGKHSRKGKFGSLTIAGHWLD